MQLYMLDGLGIHHGVDMSKVLDASQYISQALGRPSVSKAAQALMAKRAAAAAKQQAAAGK